MVGDDRPLTRDDISSLERRIEALERRVIPAATTGPQARCPRCARMVQEGRFCSACGALLHAPVPAASPAAPPPIAPAPPTAPPPAVVPGVTPAAPKADIEKLIGQRWAPRAGAVLVFLAVVFFLGVAIQRGWIGPLLQLALAALTGLALVTVGEILAARRGYGTYPQVLQATGACVLYVTAFVAWALPYYRRETSLTELGSGMMMAVVALGTVALALRHDARVIAGLGFGLGFLTATLGADALPTLTLAYVALLASALALLVARKRWLPEAVAGTLSTGGFMLWLAARSDDIGDPPRLAIALVALVPAALFLWLALREEDDETDRALAAALTFATLAWAPFTTMPPVEGDPAIGAVLLAWALVAVAYAFLAARFHAPRLTITAAGVAALLMWLAGAPLAWSGWTQAELLTTMTYAGAALVLGIFARAASRPGAAAAGIVLVAAAALYALATQGALHPPWERAGFVVGPWDAWLTLLVIAAALAPVLVYSELDARARGAAFWIAAAFGALWTFALFGAPILATAWLVALAAALIVLAAVPRERDPVLGGSALAAALAVLALVALKVTIVDTNAPGVRVDAPTGALQAVLVAGTMLALHALTLRRPLVPDTASPIAAGALIGGSALVLANWALAYTDDAWPSVLLGLLGVAYLAVGLARRTLPMYRYVGFAGLGFVLVRIFLVDLSGTDLAVRAIVFAVVGAILLGVGYAYARMSRKETPP